jgi:preprotein translocase subunit YajC
MGGLFFFALLFAAMWFFTIRPQQQRLKAQRALIAAVQAGDEVLTAGGLIGTVKVLSDDEMRLEVGPGIEIRVARAAITRRLGPDPVLDDPNAENPFS